MKNDNKKTEKQTETLASVDVQRLVRSIVSWLAAKTGCYLVDYNIEFCEFEYWDGLMDRWQTAIAEEDEEMAKYYEGRVQQCEKDEAEFLRNVIR